MATPSTCPQRLVRRPPSSSTTAPASGNATSSHAARCTPAAATVVVAGAATAPACAPAADAAAATEPVTALPPVLARGDNPPEPPGKDQTGGHRGSIFEQVRVIDRRRLAGGGKGTQGGPSPRHPGGGGH